MEAGNDTVPFKPAVKQVDRKITLEEIDVWREDASRSIMESLYKDLYKPMDWAGKLNRGTGTIKTTVNT